MEYKEYSNQIKDVQQHLIDYFENSDENSIDYIIQFFSDLKKDQTSQQIKEILHFISKFSNNYHRSGNFFEVFEKIIEIYKEEILQNFSNRQIFRIFCHNKRILLILFEKEILQPDIFIYKTFFFRNYFDQGYLNYFYPEFEQFIKKYDQIEIKRDIESFEQKRKKGENEEYISQLIQNDEVIDFITYVNRTNYSLSSKITKSIFETNSFLLKAKETSLIEYAAFYGSIQIFKYLFMNGIELTPSLWLYSIHGKNPELIHFLEENRIMPESNSFNDILIESIKCHHNEFVNYIQNNLMDLQKVSDFNFISICRKYHNYFFFPDELEINADVFYDCCEFDYISIIDFILAKNDIDLSDLNVARLLKKKVTPLILSTYNGVYSGKRFCVEKELMNVEQTPFQAAFRKGNLEIVKLLLKKLKPFDINELLVEKSPKTILAYEKTLLSIAVQSYDIDMAKYLLENTNVDVNLYSRKIFDFRPINEVITPLILAIFNEDIQMIELLLNQAKIDVNKKSVLTNTSVKDQIKCEKTPLYHAVDLKNIEILKCLISKKDININELCIDDSYSNMIDYLEAPALIKAIFIGNTKIVNFLLSKKETEKNCVFKYKKIKDNELHEKQAFYIAIELKRKEIISTFLSLPEVDVNQVNYYNFSNKKGYYETSPLYVACENGDPEIVHLLLRREDIDINFKSKYQSEINSWSEYTEKSCLHQAIDKNEVEIVRILLENPKLNVNDIYLIKRKISFSVSKQEEKTALHFAIQKNLPEIVRLLLNRKDLQINQIYIYCKTILGLYNLNKIMKTALHIAVENNCIEIVKILLAYNGIDLSIKDESGKMPIDLAQDSEIIFLLKNSLK